MKKTVYFILLFSMILGALAVPASAAEDRYSWYCKHVKEHKQPQAPDELAFIEALDGYYIDHGHADASATDKVIYLTFDVGYANESVEKILNILRDENVPAAFFILQNMIAKHSLLVERMVDEGHTVCNHTLHHKDMSGMSEEAFLAELQGLEELFEERIGKEMPKYYRPPEGVFSSQNLEFAKKHGYKTVFWSFAYPDWNNQKQMDPQKAKKIILDNIHNGEVMLLHPTSSTNAEVLPDIIHALKKEGYRFGTLDELTGVETP